MKRKLYTKCNELPIHNFNEAMQGDLSYLKRREDADVSDEELSSAWTDILDEYFRLSKNVLAGHQMKKKLQVLALRRKIEVLQIIAYCIVRKVDVSREMKAYRVTEENIGRRISMLKNDLARLENVKDEEKKSNAADFDKSIAVLISRGYQINRFTTVVSEWVAALNLLEQQNKQTKNGRAV